MIRLGSSFYILVLVVSIIEAAQNSYLDRVPGLGELIFSSGNFENELAEVENGEVPKKELRKVDDASINSNTDINVGVNLDEPIPVDDLLDQLSDEAKVSDDQHEREMAEISQELGAALNDNSMRKVFVKGVRRVVDLGLAGSTQRNRSVKKANGLTAFFSRIGKWLCGLFYRNEDEQAYKSLPSLETFPESFDVRDAWTDCKDLASLIRDQGGLGNCWAVATTSALSDTLCIASKGEYKVSLSAENVMRCCKDCVKVDDDGIKRGRTQDALNFLKTYGTVSGGEYNSKEGCIPYSFPPKTHPNYIDGEKKIAECEEKCSNQDYPRLYENDKYYVYDYKKYELPADEAAVKKHLTTKGPCIAKMLTDITFTKYYKKGIYNSWSWFTNTHVLRLIGWGEENASEYWLVANSLGKSWGEDGIGKINKENGCEFGKPTWCIEVTTDT